MSKTIKNIWEEHFTFDKFLEAHERAKKGKSQKKEILLFEMDLETNLINIMNQIKRHTFDFGQYHEFILYEPKKRIIKSLPYKARVVHQWYVEEFIKPYMMPRFITHTYACLPLRGAHKAVHDLQKMMRIMKRKFSHYYILKCDIKGYFYNINRKILFEIMKEKISSRELLYFTRKLIFDSPEEKGIPIGNYTSQFFANIYLDKLDHYVKEVLRVKYYIRYMDDFILLCQDKREAKELFIKIRMFVSSTLDLELNQKSKYYPSRYGVDFCGYITYETHRLIRKNSKKKMRKKIKHWNQHYEKGCLCMQDVRLSWNSWLGHIHHANAYYLMNQYKKKMRFVNEETEFW